MKIKYYFSFLVATLIFAISCSDFLDIPPKNIVQDPDLFGSSKGMTVYLSRIYSQMPYEDFKYSPRAGFFHDWLVCPGINEGSSIGRDGCFAMTGEGGNLWPGAFSLLRDINKLIETLPTYKANYTDAQYNHFLGEGYFARAFVFYAMAKRYGGIPLATKVLNYPEQPVCEKISRWYSRL